MGPSSCAVCWSTRRQTSIRKTRKVPDNATLRSELATIQAAASRAAASDSAWRRRRADVNVVLRERNRDPVGAKGAIDREAQLRESEQIVFGLADPADQGQIGKAPKPSWRITVAKNMRDASELWA